MQNNTVVVTKSAEVAEACERLLHDCKIKDKEISESVRGVFDSYLDKIKAEKLWSGSNFHLGYVPPLLSSVTSNASRLLRLCKSGEFIHLSVEDANHYLLVKESSSDSIIEFNKMMAGIYKNQEEVYLSLISKSDEGVGNTRQSNELIDLESASSCESESVIVGTARHGCASAFALTAIFIASVGSWLFS